MSDRYLNQTGLTRLWSRIREQQAQALAPLFEAESFGPAPQVSFSADYGGLPLRKCLVKIQPLQEGSGEPSPENVRPISGRDSVDLVLSPTASAEDGRTISVQLPETVYGGTLDVLTGTLTVDRKGHVFNGTESWGQFWSAPHRCFRLVVSGTQVRSLINRASSHFANVSVTSGTTAVGYYAYNGTASAVYVQFRPNLTDIPDLSSWKAWLAAQHQAGTPLTCWHTIAVPKVFQLSPRMVTALKGQNNIWADCGDVTVEYGAFLQAIQQEIEVLAE